MQWDRAVISEPCETCQGRGRVRREKVLESEFLPGWTTAPDYASKEKEKPAFTTARPEISMS